MVTVLYDGRCSVCAMEINHYRKAAPARVFHWIDIGSMESKDTVFDTFGVSQFDALRELHVIDSMGKAHIGVAAFCVIWSYLPRWRVIAKIVRLPIAFALATGVYALFVRYRMHRGYCNLPSDRKT